MQVSKTGIYCKIRTMQNMSERLPRFARNDMQELSRRRIMISRQAFCRLLLIFVGYMIMT